MSEISAIRSALSNVSKSQQTMFAITCAERTAAIFRRLASPASVSVYDTVLDAAWNAVKTRTPITTEVRESLISLPEAEIDDSHRPEYQATFAMGVLEHALESLATANSHEAADLACCQSLDLYSSFDAIVQGSPNVIVNPATAPSPGPLESAEIAEQSETLQILAEECKAGTDICDRLRERAKSASRILDSAITMLLNSRK